MQVARTWLMPEEAELACVEQQMAGQLAVERRLVDLASGGIKVMT